MEGGCEGRWKGAICGSSAENPSGDVDVVVTAVEAGSEIGVTGWTDEGKRRGYSHAAPLDTHQISTLLP
jgi:hypothetical protein